MTYPQTTTSTTDYLTREVLRELLAELKAATRRNEQHIDGDTITRLIITLEDSAPKKPLPAPRPYGHELF